MSASTTEHLLTAQASDGLITPGVRIDPAGGGNGTCIVWIPGFGLSYDYPPAVDLGRRLATGGTAFLSAAVRGHHGAVTAWRQVDGRLKTRLAGSWYEIFEENSGDIQAWLDCAHAAGFERVILAGHSFGADKVLYHLGTAGDAGVDGVVLASPSRGITTLTGETLALAREYLDRDEGTHLLPDGSWPRGFGTRTVSAQTYESWSRAAALIFGSDTTWKRAITGSVLAFYGDDQDVGGEAELADFVAGMDSARRITTAVLPGVQHNFEAGTGTIAAAIRSWLDTDDRILGGTR
jgi:pimeloyl-ACP methyl ester carboxylesterase